MEYPKIKGGLVNVGFLWFLFSPILVRHFYNVTKNSLSCLIYYLETLFCIGNEETTIAMPDMVRKSLLSQLCDSKEIVNQFKESLKLSQVSLKMPDDETKKWIRCLAREAKLLGKLDVVESLRNISPPGTTGQSITFVLSIICRALFIFNGRPL